MDFQTISFLLNDKDAETRLYNLQKVKSLIDMGELVPEVQSNSVNNHIHTIYSFSPYSPTLALFNAWRYGLKTAGIMDHDSVGGAKEFIKAGEIMGMLATCGMECRVKVDSTKLAGKKLNNPDQKSVAYLSLHGIPHDQIDYIYDFMAPYRAKRNERNKKMCAKINELVVKDELKLDFEKDVLPLSNYADGGSVTERHITYALADKLDKVFKDRKRVIEYLEKDLALPLSDKVKERLLDPENVDCYLYDILGILKGNLVEKFYVDADEECMTIEEFLELAHKTGSIAVYPYLGDVGDSVTGDKKAQKFEDDYLDLLFEEISRLGFDAVAYMPTRNTLEQLNRVMNYCDKYGFFQISGEDINSPRQSFICKALENPNFKHLYDNTYALIGHEIAATKCFEDGMFTEKTKKAYPDLKDRIAHFKEIALSSIK